MIAAKAAKKKQRSPWSPTLDKAWAEIHLLKMIKSQLRNTRIQNWSAIFHWRDTHPGIVPTIPTTLPETDAMLREAYLKLKSIRQAADAHRKKHLEERATLYAALEAKSQERII